MQPDKIIQRFTALEAERRSTVDHQWQLVERFIAPGRGKFFQTEQQEGELTWRRREIYNSTGMECNDTLSSSMHANLTNPATQWFSVAFRDTEIQKIKEAAVWAEEVSHEMWWALQDSNFNLEINETYIDLTGFGTNAIVEEVKDPFDWDGLNFQSIPIREIYFEEDWNGDVLRLYRKLNWTPVQIVDRFGKENCPLGLVELAEGQMGSTTRKTVIFCIFERTQYQDQDISKPIAPLARPFGFKYVLQEGCFELGTEGGYYEMPAFVGRWKLMSGSKWAFSPGIMALPTVLTLNQAEELYLRGWEKFIDPPNKTTERGLLGDLDLEAGGLLVVRAMDQLEPYITNTRFDIGDVQMDRLEDQIKRIFMVDQLAVQENTSDTAFEFAKRYEMMQKILGPTLGRLQSDLFNKIIHNTYRIMLRAGQLPEVPGIVLDMGAQLDIRYVGPLARAQKADEILSVERWVGQLASLAEVQPEMLDIPDWDEIGRGTADILDVPAKMVRSQAQIDQIRKDRAELQKAQAEAEITRQAGEAAQAAAAGADALAATQAGPGAAVMDSLAGGGGPLQ